MMTIIDFVIRKINIYCQSKMIQYCMSIAQSGIFPSLLVPALLLPSPSDVLSVAGLDDGVSLTAKGHFY